MLALADIRCSSLIYSLLLDFPPLSWSVLILADVLIDQHAHTQLPSPFRRTNCSSFVVLTCQRYPWRSDPSVQPSYSFCRSSTVERRRTRGCLGLPLFRPFARSRANFTLCASPIDPKENESLVEGENGLCISHSESRFSG